MKVEKILREICLWIQKLWFSFLCFGNEPANKLFAGVCTERAQDSMNEKKHFFFAKNDNQIFFLRWRTRRVFFDNPAKLEEQKFSHKFSHCRNAKWREHRWFWILSSKRKSCHIPFLVVWIKQETVSIKATDNTNRSETENPRSNWPYLTLSYVPHNDRKLLQINSRILIKNGFDLQSRIQWNKHSSVFDSIQSEYFWRMPDALVIKSV